MPVADDVLLERVAELGRLGRLLEGLGSSGGRAVLVRGEAGVGKSALVSRFLAEVGGGAHVLLGACDDLLTPQPMGPVWDMAHQEASLSAPLSRGDRRAVMEALLALLSRRLRPTVVVFEDMQWADEATLDVTMFLGRRIGRTHGLLVLTYRDGEVDSDHPLRQVIGELQPQDLVRMSLAPLSAEAVAAMVEGTSLDVGEVMALTGGNPLFVTEVLAWGVDEVPASVRDSVLARAAKLSAPCRRVLDLVSVFPGGAGRGVVDAILGQVPEELAQGARRGLLLVGDEVVRFRHEMTRRAVESALSGEARRLLNRRVLARIAPWADPAVVVHHAREAGDVQMIVEYAPQAVRAAKALGSYREVLEHFRALEPHLGRIEPADRAAILEDKAWTEKALDKGEAIDTLQRAIELHRAAGSDRALARALASAVRFHQWDGRPEAADACLAEAAAILKAYGPGRELAYALSQQAWLAMIRGAEAVAIDVADRAIGMAEAVGDERTIIDALTTKGCGLSARGDPAGFEVLEECRRRAEQHGYLEEEERALGNMAGMAMLHFELERASSLAQRSREMITARHKTSSVFAEALLADISVLRGDWAAAEDTYTELLVSSPRFEFAAKCQLGRLRARAGRPGARTLLGEAWAAAQAIGETQHLLGAAAALAEHLWLAGEDDPDLMRRFPEILHAAVDAGHLLAAGDLAFWLWQLGHLAAIPDGIPEPYRVLMAGRPLEAATMWEKRGLPYEQALALTHDGAAEQVRALRIFEGLGASATARRLRRLLRDRGVRVPRGRAMATRRHSAGLTARQAEVLGLVTEGLTTAQIADRLFISHRTVDNHLAAIFLKLDVTSRQAAADAASRRGLLSTA